MRTRLASPRAAARLATASITASLAWLAAACSGVGSAGSDGAKAPAAADPLPRSTAQREGIDEAALARAHALVERTVTRGDHAGAITLVARHGKLVDWRAFGVRDVATKAPMQLDTIVRIYSMSKVVTAVAALVLFDRGVLPLDAEIARWLPELREPQVWVDGTLEAPQLVKAERPITVAMLLNHTAGFTYDFFRTSPVHELYRRADLWNAPSLDEFMQRVAALPLLAQPGSAWNYSIADDVLGALIERASGQPFETFVREHVTGPLRMVDTGFDVPPEQRHRLATLSTTADGALREAEVTFGAYAEAGRGFASGGAGMFSTIGDYARFAQMLCNSGTLDGARIVSRKTLELASLDSLRGAQTTGVPGDGWGLLSAVRNDVAASLEPSSRGMLYWGGAATTTFFVDREEALVGLLFCQHTPYDQHNLLRRFRVAVEQTLDAPAREPR